MVDSSMPNFNSTVQCVTSACQKTEISTLDKTIYQRLVLWAILLVITCSRHLQCKLIF